MPSMARHVARLKELGELDVEADAEVAPAAVALGHAFAYEHFHEPARPNHSRRCDGTARRRSAQFDRMRKRRRANRTTAEHAQSSLRGVVSTGGTHFGWTTVSSGTCSSRPSSVRRSKVCPVSDWISVIFAVYSRSSPTRLKSCAIQKNAS